MHLIFFIDDSHDVATCIPTRANGCANGNGHSYDKRDQEGEDCCDKDAFSQISQVFLYPPPASKAPLPPPEENSNSIGEKNNPVPLEVRSTHAEHNGVVEKYGAPAFDDSQSPITSGILSETIGISDNGSCFSNKNIFEVEGIDNASPPIAAPRKLHNTNAASCENNQSLSNVKVSVAEQDSVNGSIKAGRNAQQYVNVKPQLERMSSAPAMSSTYPVYAELTPVNKRTRLMSFSAGNRHLSNDTKTKNRIWRSTSGVEGPRLSNPSRKLSAPKPLDCLNNVLVGITEVEEVVLSSTPPSVDGCLPILTMSPGDYLEPVHQNSS